MSWVWVLVVVVGMAAAVVFWRRLLWSRRANPSAILWLALVSLLLAVCLQVPAVYRVFAHELGFNLFWPLQWALAMACNVLLHVFSNRVSTATKLELERPARRRVTVLAAINALAFVTATALFTTNPNDPDFFLGPESRLEVPGRVDFAVGLAWIIIMCTIAVSLVGHVMGAHRWANKAKNAGRSWLRAGMRVFTLGLFLCMAYCAHSALYQAAEIIGWIPGWRQAAVTDPLISVGPALVFIGMVLPAVGSWKREHDNGSALLRRLAPVQRLLARRSGPVKPTLRTTWLRLWRPTELVYQAIIDLEDTYLRIRGHLPTGPERFDGETQRAVVLAAGLATLARGIEPPGKEFAEETERTMNTLADLVAEHHPLPESVRHTKVYLNTDIDRWLRAAAIIEGYPGIVSVPSGSRPLSDQKAEHPA
ncbi:hypothetical protein SAMN05421504_103595 [Amycolatopsis xylanica]|uniref:Uncharacterized protein n=1 Tax=Amycolatopsis xylanica TaxID=589385 RepID=A0A1H3E1Q0_9PSEU|nr:hypothetical protein [Amycolatopsis xylanica]SDX71834.1 hypothetical protein SAMN05421504_103595 [Amycolatopsis xylanica]